MLRGGIKSMNADVVAVLVGRHGFLQVLPPAIKEPLFGDETEPWILCLPTVFKAKYHALPVVIRWLSIGTIQIRVQGDMRIEVLIETRHIQCHTLPVLVVIVYHRAQFKIEVSNRWAWNVTDPRSSQLSTYSTWHWQ